ncbi:hypothetical protein TL16_g03641 [Triparma laevis f. inornata]|uniref:chitin synthase n=1 Tax=Triparma laevis f. inornata TaxID=1714386 RepID=A0A9W7E078_9STRA|nr:hypothetical protein TL16_g03641 [Triparma laevis f. inornata]
MFTLAGKKQNSAFKLTDREEAMFTLKKKGSAFNVMRNPFNPRSRQKTLSLIHPALTLLIVADRLEKQSTSMKSYLKDTFLLDERIFLSDSAEVWGVAGQTFISPPTTVKGCRMQCLLKRYNHRKINSHEGVFMVMVPNTGCDYAFTTDCGAIFLPDAVYKLIDHLFRNQICVAVTGRQRVMKESNQRALGQIPPQRDTWFESCLRELQGFDFELDHVAWKAANCASGLLPCLHGPCAMFRYADIAGQCLDEYFDVWGYAPPNIISLLGANLQLAEDRIPSLLGMLYSGKTSDSVFDAPFEFEAELSLKAFITQRRRWGNGALPSLLFGVRNTYTTLNSSYTIFFKVANITILIIQIISSVLTYLTPALFGFLFGATVRAVATEIVPHHAYSIEIAFYIFYGSLYVIFVAVHLKRSAPHDNVVSVPLFSFVIFINVIMMILVIATIVYEKLLYSTLPIILTFAAISFWPFINVLISGSKEAISIMVRALPVFTPTPTFIAFLSAYNISRLADLTWGNRPTISKVKREERRKSLAMDGENANANDPAILELWLKQQMKWCGALNDFIVGINLVLMVFMESILKSIAFLPEIYSTRSVAATYDGALEVRVAFSSPWVLQLLVGTGFHCVRWAK